MHVCDQPALGQHRANRTSFDLHDQPCRAGAAIDQLAQIVDGLGVERRMRPIVACDGTDALI